MNTVVKSEWVSAPPSLSRYNGYSAINIVGSQAPGTSSGEAMQTMEGIVNDDLPAGFGYDWSGMSYRKSWPATLRPCCWCCPSWWCSCACRAV